MSLLRPRKRPTPPVEPRDPSEVARFLREQPQIAVPRRNFETPQRPGLLAHTLLGHRIITRYQV